METFRNRFFDLLGNQHQNYLKIKNKSKQRADFYKHKDKRTKKII